MNCRACSSPPPQFGTRAVNQGPPRFAGRAFFTSAAGLLILPSDVRRTDSPGGRMAADHSFAELAERQMAIFWRILHLLTRRYGNFPTGQMLVALTMVFLNERGKPPTMTELCRATGLPKASVSRYVSWQIKQGFAEERIDPGDRRQRRLVQTSKGREERMWQAEAMQALFAEIDRLGPEVATRNAQELLNRMIELTQQAPERFG